MSAEIPGCLIRMAGVAAVAAAMASRPADAQQTRTVPSRSLSAVEIEHPESFTTISSLRELSDGRVLAADARERMVKLLDFAHRRALVVGRRGQGPEEYGSAGGLLAARADTTWLVDGSNGRMLVIAPDGRIVGTISLISGESVPPVAAAIVAAASAPPRGTMTPSFIDSAGRLYGGAGLVHAAPANPSGRVSMRSYIRRWDRTRGTIDTVDSIASDHIRGSPGRVQTRIPTPFGLRDAWIVAHDGTIVIARAADYHLEWIAPSGSRVRGAPIPYQRLPVTADERRGATDRARAAASTESRLRSLARGFSPTIPDGPWPEFKAPFDGELHIAPDGRIWIPITPPRRGDAITYDVVEKGRGLVERVTMPPRTVLVGFGRQAIYTARVDDDDLHYLQRRRFRD